MCFGILITSAIICSIAPVSASERPMIIASVKLFGAHDGSSLHKALLGHWVTDDGSTHYYFGSTSLVMVDNGRHMDMTYTVIDINEAKNWVLIRTNNAGYGHFKELEFSSDRKTLTEKVRILSVEMKTRWDYVDSKVTP